MFRLAAVLFIAVSGVARARGSCSSGVCVDVHAEEPSEVGVELLQRAKQRKVERQIPGLGGIIEAGRSALSNVTDTLTKEVNSVVSNVTDTLSKQVGSVAGSLTSTAATAVASTLNTALQVLGSRTDELFATCKTVRDRIVEKVSRTEADAYSRIDVLEEQVKGAVSQVLPLWGNVSAAVVAASSVATPALASVGQEEIAEKLNSSLSVALEQANSVAESLQNVTVMMDSIRNVKEDELSEALAQVQDTLQVGLQRADSFATRVSTAFGELTNEAAVKIAAAIPGVDADAINEAFDSVDTTVKQVADDLVDGPHELVNGVSQAVDMVEETLPGERSAAHQAASSLGLALLAGLLALAA